MIDIRQAALAALPKEMLLDLADQHSADAMHTHNVVEREFRLNAKRRSATEGQIRFRLQEESFEEVVQMHGGHLITDGVMVGTNLKIFQPFTRFTGPDVGVILGFATMPERRKLPARNMSRAAGVTLNVRLQPSLLDDQNSPKPTDIFVLFLIARDRERVGMIDEIAVGVIGSDYKDFLFYETLDQFLSGYGADAPPAEGPDQPGGEGELVKLRPSRKLFIPPESRPDRDAEGETDE